jgi:hypothetical protein
MMFVAFVLVTLTGVAGMIGLFSIIGAPAVERLPPDLLTKYLIAAAATVFGIVALLVFLVVRMLGGTERSADSKRSQPVHPSGPAHLASPGGVISSVTEGTTRGFDRVETRQPER